MYKNERILNIYIISIIVLIISNISNKIRNNRNIFIKHLARSKNTSYLCAH